MTVSRVINNHIGVRELTRQKVVRSINALNYAPNPAAQSLAGGDEMRIGLLYSNPSSSYLSEVLVGCLAEASRSNMDLTVEQFDDAIKLDELVDRLRRGGVNGIILPPPLCDSPKILAAFQAVDLPTVLMATGTGPTGTAAVSVDDFRAAYEMATHIVGLGHTRIGFVRGNPNQRASELRFKGYVAALEAAGIVPESMLVAQGYFTYRSGLDAAEQILDLTNRPTAIFASNDDMAAAAVAVANRRGLDVPGDLTVCGFDDTLLATTIWPELTTIRQPISDMSRTAVNLMARQLRGGTAFAGQDGTQGTHVQLDHFLIRRQSDAAPRRRPRHRDGS
ncbi:LacI family DNA-binding transcriptional regulator [Novosphingobium kaempferiae]|uniref:LacI family DNA-binding transcriptional regulator n=1 Tax=Novosphingobium kaempferiae TaxID=2896849 RepID=UPI001E64C209|nr:LacI family DNA-binding transcriptional regulator [Novosphingobium kaempferiae]